MIIERVPRCPQCKEPAIPVRKDYFRCPECGFVWEEIKWSEKVALEEAIAEAVKATAHINALLAVGDGLHCDKCGQRIKHGDKYCYNTKEQISEATNGVGRMKKIRGTRYCVNCSLKAGYLNVVKNTVTGETYPAKFVLPGETIIYRNGGKNNG